MKPLPAASNGVSDSMERPKGRGIKPGKIKNSRTNAELPFIGLLTSLKGTHPNKNEAGF